MNFDQTGKQMFQCWIPNRGSCDVENFLQLFEHSLCLFMLKCSWQMCAMPSSGSASFWSDCQFCFLEWPVFPPLRRWWLSTFIHAQLWKCHLSPPPHAKCIASPRPLALLSGPKSNCHSLVWSFCVIIGFNNVIHSIKVIDKQMKTWPRVFVTLKPKQTVFLPAFCWARNNITNFVKHKELWVGTVRCFWAGLTHRLSILLWWSAGLDCASRLLIWSSFAWIIGCLQLLIPLWMCTKINKYVCIFIVCIDCSILLILSNLRRRNLHVFRPNLVHLCFDNYKRNVTNRENDKLPNQKKECQNAKRKWRLFVFSPCRRFCVFDRMRKFSLTFNPVLLRRLLHSVGCARRTPCQSFQCRYKLHFKRVQNCRVFWRKWMSHTKCQFNNGSNEKGIKVFRLCCAQTVPQIWKQLIHSLCAARCFTSVISSLRLSSQNGTHAELRSSRHFYICFWSSRENLRVISWLCLKRQVQY